MMSGEFSTTVTKSKNKTKNKTKKHRCYAVQPPGGSQIAL